MNKSIFIGRMATDPKVMSSAGKKTVAYFRIAVERNFKQEGAPNADYFSCVTFGERAEFVAKYFYKGKKIALEGEMHNDNYTGDISSLEQLPIRLTKQLAKLLRRVN